MSKDDNNAIIVDNVTKSFKVFYDKPSTLKERLVFWNKKKVDERVVLKNINVNIKKGETVALIGTNGSGKSTLLKLMTQIIYPTKGKIKTRGKLTSLLELGAGFHPDFTGRENIYFNSSIFGLTKKEIAEALFLSEGTVRNYISTVLSKLGLRDRTNLAIFYYKILNQFKS